MTAAYRTTLLAVSVSFFGLMPGLTRAMAADALAAGDTAQPSTAELLREVKAMERRIRVLEAELQQRKKAEKATTNVASTAAPAPPTPGFVAPPVRNAPPPAQAAMAESQTQKNKDIFGLAPSPIDGLKVGMYGELKFGAQQNPADNGHWQKGFDAARIVLLPSYQFTDDIVFNAEIEFEHAGIAFDNDDKLHGTAEVEQAYVDFRISPYLNIRSPGVDIVPISFNNLFHEPTQFYSVNRPELANGLIPSTWVAPSTGIYGKIVDGLEYQLQFSSSIEDFGDGFDARTAANTVPAFPTAYAAGIDGHEALSLAKAPLGDFRQLSNEIATTGRLAYTSSFLPGFAGSTAVYYSPNTTPRGAHGDSGVALGSSSLTIVDSEFRYRPPSTGWEIRGEYAQAFFGNPRNLRANNDGDPTNNVGDSMLGLSGEVAYHIRLGSFLGGKWEAVPFYRYSYENLQGGGFRGTDLNQPNGAGKLQFHTVGAALFPTPQLVLKLNYQRVLDDEPGGANSDSVLGGLGFLF